jgi:predicted metal-dependent hydrolase
VGFCATISFVKKTIILDGQKVSYTLRTSSRARNLRMTMELDGTLVVTIPAPWFGRFVEKFLRQKSSWILKHIEKMKKLEGKTIIKPSKREFEAHKNEIFRRVKERLEFFNRFYQLPYKKVSIRNQSSLWGSCTRAGNLQFNYKLMYVPPKTFDYVIVHELCHLKEHNHSAHFWALVAKMIPDYKIIRRSLRQYILREG